MENLETTPAPAPTIAEHTATIVAAYVGRNAVTAAEIPKIIAEVRSALMGLGNHEIGLTPQEPAVSVRSSIKPDALTCLDCGARFKSLKRHIRTQHELTPEQYRKRWSLPPDYPMVAPIYSQRRSQIAKEVGLGTNGVSR